MAFRDKLVSLASDSVGKEIINQYIAKYGKVKSLYLKDGKINVSLILNGFDDKEICISCASVDIAEDGSQIRLCDFRANVPCIEQALNDFCPSFFPVKSTKAQRFVVMAKKLLF